MKAYFLYYDIPYELGYFIGIYSSNRKAKKARNKHRRYSGNGSQLYRYEIHEFDIDTVNGKRV